MIDPSSIGRLVIRAPNWLGDAVMALPAMAAVREAFRHATVAVAAPSAIAPLFHEQTNAAPDELLTVVSRRQEATALREGRFDAILLLPNSFRSAWIARRAGIPQRAGTSRNLRGWLLTAKASRGRERQHQSVRYLQLVRGLGLNPADTLPRVTVTPETGRRAAALLRESGVAAGARLVGLAPGAAYGHAKRWPPARVAELIARLIREQDAVCVLLGAAADREAGREIESKLSSDTRVINLIGRTDLRVLTGVLAACGAFVSNDSGAMHLAAAVGVSVTAIFGPTDERVTAPLGEHDILLQDVFCRPCMLRDCPIDHRCMKRISVDEVFKSVARRLARVD